MHMKERKKVSEKEDIAFKGKWEYININNNFTFIKLTERGLGFRV